MESFVSVFECAGWESYPSRFAVGVDGAADRRPSEPPMWGATARDQLPAGCGCGCCCCWWWFGVTCTCLPPSGAHGVIVGSGGRRTGVNAAGCGGGWDGREGVRAAVLLLTWPASSLKETGPASQSHHVSSPRPKLSRLSINFTQFSLQSFCYAHGVKIVEEINTSSCPVTAVCPRHRSSHPPQGPAVKHRSSRRLPPPAADVGRHVLATPCPCNRLTDMPPPIHRGSRCRDWCLSISLMDQRDDLVLASGHHQWISLVRTRAPMFRLS